MSQQLDFINKRSDTDTIKIDVVYNYIDFKVKKNDFKNV